MQLVTAAAPVAPNALAAADAAIAAGRWLVALRARALVAFLAAIPPPAVTPTTVAPAPEAPTVGGCGGDLPPCYVVARESGGSYTAVNATGCGGNGCFGKYQFSGAWAGKLGLPADIARATPAQQDAAARELWADGAGCSNWSAC